MLIVCVIYMCILGIVWVMLENIPIFICAWQLQAMEKIKDVKVQQEISHDMHNVIFCLLNLKNKLMSSKNDGELKVLRSFEQHALGNAWINYFWTYYNQFGMCS